MKTSDDDMLPLKKDDPHGLYEAGDIRANENIVLTSYHTIFVREHNRLCNAILRKAPFMTDEEIYQAARNYVIGLLQKITFYDFLPMMLGEKMFNQYIGKYKGYNPEANPNIET